ncbi:SRPBCC family protein [Phenylobacterium sp.]|uniref:SRPBCC family protein n=1 Tax=Phenylobacterium sp. TaxID=1871053 RepID=UPI002DF2F316|nr:SRPBCC family protein [Phenylobacterium sp.]
MAESTFIYVTYIRTTPDALWTALTDTDFIPQWWMGVRTETDWRVGGPWKLVLTDGRVADTGEVLEFEPPKRLALKWRNEFMPEAAAEGWSHCLFELEPQGEAVKLTVTHSMPREKSKLIQAVSGGWPQILSNLKTLIETGSALVAQRTAEAAQA